MAETRSASLSDFSHIISWSALGKLMFEGAYVSSGITSKSNINTEKLMLYEHSLQIRQGFAN